MMEITVATVPKAPLLSIRQSLAYAAGALACFHLAYFFTPLAFLIAPALYCLYRLAFVPTTRIALYGGWALGLAFYVPHLWWFFGIFNVGAILLWLAMGLAIPLYLLFSRYAVGELPRRLSPWLVPFIWTGVEFFRCELNPWKFAWLMPAWVFDRCAMFLPMSWLGAYGISFVLLMLAAVVCHIPRRPALALGSVVVVVLAVAANMPALAPQWRGLDAPMADLTPAALRQMLTAAPALDAGTTTQPLNDARGPVVVCVQAENLLTQDLLAYCDQAVRRYPRADIIAFSENALLAEPPLELLRWCKANNRYVAMGGTQYIPEQAGAFYNTAYVIGPEGIVHRQPKSVPVQFMKDGTPAPRRTVWQSPWGPVGLCICYDISYSYVIDDFMHQGAKMLIVPTMDVEHWGRYEHELHARVTAVRAAEYSVPIVRPCSSGVSQIVLSDGTVVASLGYGHQGEMIAAQVPMATSPTVPPDRLVMRASVAITLLTLLASAVMGIKHRRSRKAAESTTENAKNPLAV